MRAVPCTYIRTHNVSAISLGIMRAVPCTNIHVQDGSARCLGCVRAVPCTNMHAHNMNAVDHCICASIISLCILTQVQTYCRWDCRANSSHCRQLWYKIVHRAELPSSLHLRSATTCQLACTPASSSKMKTALASFPKRRSSMDSLSSNLSRRIGHFSSLQQAIV